MRCSSASSRRLFGLLVANHVVAAGLWRRYNTGDGPHPQLVPKAVFNVVVFAPLVEEFVFRGIALHVLLNRLPGHPLKCVAAQAAVFGFFHLANVSIKPPGVVALQVLLGGLVGSVYGCAVLRSGSLADSVALHVCNNAVALFGFRLGAPTAGHVPLLCWCAALYAFSLRGCAFDVDAMRQSATNTPSASHDNGPVKTD